MPRYRISIEYDGGPFAGWQRQADTPSVQGEVEIAINRLTGNASTVFAAGRTDAGVHALGQVAHFDLPTPWPADTLRDGLNAHLREHPIVVLSAAESTIDFDARFTALRRHYCYRILRRRSPPAVERGRVWHVARTLDLEAMRMGAAELVGHHDFTTFRSTDCQAKSPMKTLDRLEITQAGNEVRVEASSRSFLHSQVRSMVGTLARVGVGAWPPERVGEALRARNRAACGPVAPPYGLYLVAVDYDPSNANTPASRTSVST